MKAGALSGGREVCHGYHVWDGDECVRCGFIDSAERDDTTNHENRSER